MDANIDLESYRYHLPEDRIARYPLPDREASRLLVFNQGSITHSRFRDIADQLPDNRYLFFNETKVIPARLIFRKPTGAIIEIFLLNPVAPSTAMQAAMEASQSTSWKCLIKNFRKWNSSVILENTIRPDQPEIRLKAEIADREQKLIRFSWNGGYSFAEVVEASGKVPLPPYLKREPEPTDKTRYQTVFSRVKGAVAAPTAGLHFTERILETLCEKGHVTDYLTLHVSAGTFQPIKVKDITRHPMHREQISFSRQNIRNLLEGNGKVIAVGTTSMRTLESIYWFGVKILSGENTPLFIDKLFPYQWEKNHLPSAREALIAVSDLMQKTKSDTLTGETEIFIYPGYAFRICQGLVTNFHMPASTLILLVAAFVGKSWEKIYREALLHQYRFLSYGDSSLLLPRNL